MTKGLKPMRFTKLSLFIAGAVGILILGVPRAAHAVVATLVQVANTSANPVVTQGIGQQVAQVVHIMCGYLPGSGIGFPPYSFGCAALPPTGFLSDPTQSSEYVVPTGETLVVTSVDILSGAAAGTPCMSPAFVQFVTSVPVPIGNWIVPAGAGMAHYVYPSGILFSAGTNIVSITNQVSSCTVTVDMRGYLTAQ
jgi:hypothetical protein